MIFDGARRETVADGVEGPYLFGEFGIADAFFWPILWVCGFLANVSVLVLMDERSDSGLIMST